MTRRLKKSLWPHLVTIGSDNRPDIDPIEQWLGEHIGRFRSQWHVIYQYNRTDFYFRNGLDASMFALRWQQ